MDKRGRGFIFWIFVILVLVAMGYFGTKYYFVASILLGNDIAVKLNPSSDNVFLSGEESAQISFSTSILASPFCTASCTSRFIDLSEDKLIETKDFSLKTAIPETQDFELKTSKYGSGQSYYRFEVRCTGAKSFLCPTSGIEKSKSVLITMNYGLNRYNEQNFESYKSALADLIIRTGKLSQEVEYSRLISNSADNLEMQVTDSLSNLRNNIQNINQTLFDAKGFLENFKLTEVNFRVEESLKKIITSETEYSKVNSSIYSKVNSYNQLIENLTSLKIKLEELKQISASNETAIEINNLIGEYNELISKFNGKSTLNIKQGLVNDVYSKIISYSAVNDVNSSIKASSIINSVPGKINLTGILASEIGVEFKNTERQCCLFGKCSVCCKNCSDKNYPVILLHGHAFNRIISAEYSLEDFQEIQSKLENEGFLNAGALLISPQEEQRDIWADINYPLTLRASYYFDIYKNPGESSVIQTKSDNLDSYALRLKDIIDSAKYKTGKNKVIIVSHSMGGLVTRKYMQIYGSDNIDKFVMIGTPNKGIKDNVLTICSAIGESAECENMDETSLFLNKLNYGEAPKIPTYGLIGTGCDMNGETGDGIVTNSSASLSSAQNYYFEGMCESKINFLHNKLLNPYSHPDVYNKLVEILKS